MLEAFYCQAARESSAAVGQSRHDAGEGPEEIEEEMADALGRHASPDDYDGTLYDA